MGPASGTAAGAREVVTRESLLDALSLLAGIPSAAGSEARLAAEVCRFGKELVPAADWVTQPVGEQSANVVASSPAGAGECKVLLYTHLDTTLSGDPQLDYPLTGIRDAPPGFSYDDEGRATGPGLAVSKAPAACALVAFAAIARGREGAGTRDLPGLGLLLSAGGTHRAPSGGFPSRLPSGIDQGLGIGVETALRLGVRPKYVINVKGGATGVLREEPGLMFLRLELTDAMVPVPNRGDAAGGAVRAARVAELVEKWRGTYTGSTRRLGREVAADAGVGAIESGLPFKPDLLPGAANVYVYVVTLPGVDGHAIVADLEAYVQDAMPGLDPDWSEERLRVHVFGAQPGAGTPADSPIVRAARESWEAAFGAGSANVQDYTGSTDGVIFRRQGIDTVRLGVTARSSAVNHSVETVSVDDMLAVTAVYVDTLEKVL